jgi:hypothetical protein
MTDYDRWFTEVELAEMTRPTMDRLIEALDRDDTDMARQLARGMKNEWRFLHDLMVESVLGLVDFIKRRDGEDVVAEAWQGSMERGWKRDTKEIVSRDRRQIVEALASTWRAHSTSGKGPHPGAFTIEEDSEKFTFLLHPCGSGQRLVLRGMYDGPDGYATTDRAHDWSFGRSGLPIYCTHCTFMNETMPMDWYGFPLYPLDPPEDYHRDPCRWYWYKDPADIPERFWERYGRQKPASLGGSGAVSG